MIKSETLSFDDAIEDTTNKLLVLNVLRARDEAPLHFSSIGAIHESIQQSASLSILDLLGARNGSTQRNSATIGMGTQVTPTFDVNHIDSKEFATGIASPIDPKFVKYWLDRGLDRRLVLLLFFSAADITETVKQNNTVTKITTIRVTNTPRESIDTIRARVSHSRADTCNDKSQFEFYLSLLNGLKKFVATSIPDARLIGTMTYDPKHSARFLQAIAAAEQSKLTVKAGKDSVSYKLFAPAGEPKILFCFYHGTAPKLGMYAEGGRTGATSPVNQNECDGTDDATADLSSPPPAAGKQKPPLLLLNSPKDDSNEYCRVYEEFSKSLQSNKKDSSIKLQLQIRSVGEMIHFLGDLLYYQDELHKLEDDSAWKAYAAKWGGEMADLHVPVTLGYCPRKGRTDADINIEGRWDILFNLDNDPARARFGLTYRSKQYAVGHFEPPKDLSVPNSTCDEDFKNRKDHSLEVLSVLQQLVNLNRSATDVRATPFVQVLP